MTHFGFGPASAQTDPDGTVITRTAGGFDLALHSTRVTGVPQPFLHVGFRLAASDDVRTALARARADGIEIIEHSDEADTVSFNCPTRDGHRVEVHWERDG